MRRAGFRLIVVLLLGMALIQNMGSVVAVNDTTPPVFQSLSVSATTISAGQTATITAHITDDMSGVATSSNSAYVFFNLQGTTGQSIYGNFSLASGTL